MHALQFMACILRPRSSNKALSDTDNELIPHEPLFPCMLQLACVLVLQVIFRTYFLPYVQHRLDISKYI